MADRWLTTQDVFDPASTMLRIQQIKQAQQQQQMNEMQMQQMQQQQARNQAFEQWKTGQQPMQVAQLPSPQQIEQNQAIMRGQKKLASMSTRIDQEYSSDKINGANINQIARMKRNDPDIKTLIASTGYDDIDFGYDDKKKEAWERYTKTWTKDELEKLSTQIPGGQVLAGLPAGKYTLEFDPITKTLRPNIQSGSKKSVNSMDLMNDPSLTDNDLARAAVLGSPLQRQQARAIMAEKAKYRAEEYQTKYGGGITPEAIKFAGEQYIYSGKMPPMGRSAFVRAKIMQSASDIAANLGMTVPELMTMQADKKALALSLNQQIKSRGAMGSFIRNINAQTELLKNKLPELQRANARVLNIPIRQYLKKIQGSADEAIFETYLTEISSEIAKLATGSTESVAEVSVTAREKWENIHDANMPIGEIFKLVDSVRHLGEVRLQSVDDEIEATKQKISTKADQRKTGKPRFKILRVQ